jgi:hypothetical protein
LSAAIVKELELMLQLQLFCAPEDGW